MAGPAGKPGAAPKKPVKAPPVKATPAKAVTKATSTPKVNAVTGRTTSTVSAAASRAAKTSARPVARAKTSYGNAAGSPIVNRSTGFVTGARAATTRPTSSYPGAAAAKSKSQPQKNPVERILTPGAGTIEGAMKTGTMKNNPLKRILGGR